MLITRTFSLTNFIIATSALGFQVFVLYPWHQRLEEDFERLHTTQMQHIKDENTKRVEERKERISELAGMQMELRMLREQRSKGTGEGEYNHLRGWESKDGDRLV